MIYTAQTIADNGNWAAPDGTQSLYHRDNRDGIERVLETWGDCVAHYDNRRDAYLMVWAGEHHSDVTDLYPDFKVSYGPRGGIRWESV